MVAVAENKPIDTLSDRYSTKAVEGNDVRPTPPLSVSGAKVTEDYLSKVENCPSCEVVFDVRNRQEMLRAMVIGDALNSPRFRTPFGKRR